MGIGGLTASVESVKDAYRQLHWAGNRVGEDATCVACGEQWSVGCEPGCFAGDGWKALIEVCNEAFLRGLMSYSEVEFQHEHGMRVAAEAERDDLRSLAELLIAHPSADQCSCPVSDGPLNPGDPGHVTGCPLRETT